MFPTDIWHLILSHLTTKEIAGLQTVSKNLQTITTGIMQNPVFLKPLFDRLARLSPYMTIDLNSYSLLLLQNTILKINDQQMQEIHEIQNFQLDTLLTPHSTDWRPPIQAISLPTHSLSTLEKRNDLLERINTSLVRHNMQRLKNGKHLTPAPITRMPQWLYHDAITRQFFHKHYLETFNPDNLFIPANPIVRRNFMHCGADIHALSDRLIEQRKMQPILNAFSHFCKEWMPILNQIENEETDNTNRSKQTSHY